MRNENENRFYFLFEEQILHTWNVNTHTNTLNETCFSRFTHNFMKIYLYICMKCMFVSRGKRVEFLFFFGTANQLMQQTRWTHLKFACDQLFSASQIFRNEKQKRIHMVELYWIKRCIYLSRTESQFLFWQMQSNDTSNACGRLRSNLF